MKICGVSDLHGNLIKDIPTCDVLCISGDIIPLQIQRDLKQSEKWWLNDFCNWVKELPCKKVIFTAGNHDFFLADLYNHHKGDYYAFIADLENNSNDKAILLINELYAFQGITFYGFPYIRPIPFQEGKWAFEDDYKNIKDIGVYSKLENIETDILITHDNPYKNIMLMNFTKNQPKIWFYGHWHDELSNVGLDRYNCSILDNWYNMKEDFEIPTVDLETRNSIIEEVFTTMFDNIGKYTALQQYDSSQVKAIKEFLTLNKEFFLKQQEDEIPLPITGDTIDEGNED